MTWNILQFVVIRKKVGKKTNSFIACNRPWLVFDMMILCNVDVIKWSAKEEMAMPFSEGMPCSFPPLWQPIIHCGAQVVQSASNFVWIDNHLLYRNMLMFGGTDRRNRLSKIKGTNLISFYYSKDMWGIPKLFRRMENLCHQHIRQGRCRWGIDKNVTRLEEIHLSNSVSFKGHTSHHQ